MDKPELTKFDTLENLCKRCQDIDLNVSENAVKYAAVEATICDLGYPTSWPIPEYLSRYNSKYTDEHAFPKTLSVKTAEDIWKTTANGFTDWVTPMIADIKRWEETLKKGN